MTTRALQIQAELILNTTTAEAQLRRLGGLVGGSGGRGGRGGAGGGGGGGGRRRGGLNSGGLGRQIARGLGLGGLGGGLAGFAGAGLGVAAAVGGLTLLGTQAFRASRALGTSAYRDFRATSVRPNHSWQLLPATIGDRLLPVLQRFANALIHIIEFFGGGRRSGGGARVVPPTLHTGGLVRQSGLHNLQAGERVTSNAQQRESPGGNLRTEIRLAFYEGIRQLVHDGTLDLLFDRARLPSLVPTPVELGDVSVNAIAGLAPTRLTETEYMALATKDPLTLYVIIDPPASP